jgi:hypothetical protein
MFALNLSYIVGVILGHTESKIPCTVEQRNYLTPLEIANHLHNADRQQITMTAQCTCGTFIDDKARAPIHFIESEAPQRPRTLSVWRNA